MRIIFMGTPEFAVLALQNLIDSNHEVIAAYSQPPRPAGRGKKLCKSAVHEIAETNNIPVFTPTSLKSPEIQDEFKELGADVAVVAAYGLLLPKEILEACTYGCVNIHPSLLPRWRGAAPIQHTIMAGDDETGMCIMKMNEGLDTGDIYAQKNFALDEKINTGELHNKQAQLGAEMLLEVIEQLGKNTANPKPQNSDGATYASKITKEDCKLDFSRSAQELHHQIRALAPKPGAYFELNGERIKILEAEYDLNKSGDDAIVIDNEFSIGCGNGILKPIIIQKPGGKPMKISDFLRGIKIDFTQIPPLNSQN